MFTGVLIFRFFHRLRLEFFADPVQKNYFTAFALSMIKQPLPRILPWGRLVQPSTFLALLLLMLLTGCARSVPPVDSTALQPGAVFTADLHPLPMDELVALVHGADFVLIGESHTNACDHRFQETALRAFADAAHGDAMPGVGLEMVPWTKQEELDAFFRGEIALDELRDRLAWQDYWGFSFDVYRPVLAQAQALGMPLVGLNLPKELLAEIRENGLDAVPLKNRGLLPARIIPPPWEQTEDLAEAFQRHIQMVRGHDQDMSFDLDRFLLVQSLWDTQMAHVATQWRTATQRPLIILAGSGHVEYGHGIAHRLKILNHAPRILRIVPWRGGGPPDPDLAGVFFHCPEVPQPRLGLLISQERDSVLITGVVPDSRAALAGLLPGDILLAADNTPVHNLDVLHQAGKAAAQDQADLRLEVLRRDVVLEVVISFARNR